MHTNHNNSQEQVNMGESLILINEKNTKPLRTTVTEDEHAGFFSKSSGHMRVLDASGIF